MILRSLVVTGFAGAALAAGLTAPATAQAPVAGVAAAVNPDATGTPPAGPTQTLTVGLNVFQQERIVTAAAGQTQLLFLDGSTLTVGPNAEMTLDEYVYDPESHTGKIAATVAAGLFRFVGGRISKAGNVAIATPTATIGIRGGVAIVSVERGTGATTATLAYGQQLSLTGTNGAVQTITRPGFTSSVTAAGQSPSAPIRVPPAVLAQTSQLEGHAGASGGATVAPTQSQSAATPVGAAIQQAVTTQQNTTNVIASNVATAIQSTAQQQATTTAVADVVKTQTVTNSLVNAVTSGNISTDQLSTVASAVNASGASSNSAAQALLAKVTTTVNQVVAGPPTFAAYSITNDPGLNSSVPFLVNQNVPVTNLRTSPLFIVATKGNFGATTGEQRNIGILAAIDIEGSGPSQSSTVMVATGVLSRQSGPGPNDFTRPRYFVGGVAGMTRTNFNAQIGTGNSLTSVTPDAGTPFAGSSFPDSFTLTSDNTSFGQTTSSAPYGVVTQVPNTNGPNNGANTAIVTSTSQRTTQNATYTFADTATRTAPPSGVGASRTTQTLQGYATAAVLQTDSTGSSSSVNQRFFAATTGPGSFTVQTDADTSRVQATIDLTKVLPSDNSSGTGTLVYGLLSGINGSGRGGFIDDSRFAARTAVSQDTPGGPVTQYSNIGGVPVDASNGYFFSAGLAAPDNILPAGVSFCKCQYLQWGFFGGDFYSNGGATRGRLNLGTWVAGPLPSNADIPQSGTATYTGHAIGNVVDQNNQQYVAAGGFQNSWNFGTRTGTVTISKFDGRTYSGSASATADNPGHYSGTLTRAAVPALGVPGPMSVLGNFFKGGGDPARETGGEFGVTEQIGSGQYRAAGIFAGAK